MSTRPTAARGRMWLADFLELAGISKATFYERYRHDPHWVKRLDIKLDRAGRLHLSEARARQFRANQLGPLAYDRSDRADHLLRRCSECGEFLGPKSRFCSHCGKPVDTEGPTTS